MNTLRYTDLSMYLITIINESIDYHHYGKKLTNVNWQLFAILALVALLLLTFVTTSVYILLISYVIISSSLFFSFCRQRDRLQDIIIFLRTYYD
jgi:hypothetical protein